jgi:hypothetical protein
VPWLSHRGRYGRWAAGHAIKGGRVELLSGRLKRQPVIPAKAGIQSVELDTGFAGVTVLYRAQAALRGTPGVRRAARPASPGRARPFPGSGAVLPPHRVNQGHRAPPQHRGPLPRQRPAPARQSVETLAVTVSSLLCLRSDAVWIAPAGAVREEWTRGILAQLPIPATGTEAPAPCISSTCCAGRRPVAGRGCGIRRGSG